MCQIENGYRGTSEKSRAVYVTITARVCVQSENVIERNIERACKFARCAKMEKKREREKRYAFSSGFGRREYRKL